ncbi:MAG: hypothetical protein KJP21_05955 [Bacteroidia bacterium]|nr:hypothetical protein [Bacteroidia bacterium]NNJ56169.1 hypothetical protein [Bacteroidia bacterium]
MINEQTYHLINKYLNGELKGRALDKFKSDLKSNEDLRDAVTSQASIIESIKAFREDELKKNLQANLNKSRTFVIGRTFKIALASAAVVSLLVSTFFVLRPFMNSFNDTMVSEEVESSDTADDFKPTTEPQSELTQIDTQTLAIADNIKTDEIERLEEELEAPAIEVVEDDVEIEETFEETFEEESEAPDEVMIEKSAPTTTDAKDESGDDAIQDYEVKADELLSNRRYNVISISPNFSGVEETAATTAKRSSTKIKESEKEESDAVEATKAPTSSNPSRSIEVEHWKSVVNYKGYNYDGTKVKLYGINETNNLEFKELDNRLYVKIEGKQYFIEKNKDYKRLVEVTSPALLNVLND